MWNPSRAQLEAEERIFSFVEAKIESGTESLHSICRELLACFSVAPALHPDAIALLEDCVFSHMTTVLSKQEREKRQRAGENAEGVGEPLLSPPKSSTAPLSHVEIFPATPQREQQSVKIPLSSPPHPEPMPPGAPALTPAASVPAPKATLEPATQAPVPAPNSTPAPTPMPATPVPITAPAPAASAPPGPTAVPATPEPTASTAPTPAVPVSKTAPVPAPTPTPAAEPTPTSAPKAAPAPLESTLPTAGEPAPAAVPKPTSPLALASALLSVETESQPTVKGKTVTGTGLTSKATGLHLCPLPVLHWESASFTLGELLKVVSSECIGDHKQHKQKANKEKEEQKKNKMPEKEQETPPEKPEKKRDEENDHQQRTPRDKQKKQEKEKKANVEKEAKAEKGKTKDREHRQKEKERDSEQTEKAQKKEKSRNKQKPTEKGREREAQKQMVPVSALVPETPQVPEMVSEKVPERVQEVTAPAKVSATVPEEAPVQVPQEVPVPEKSPAKDPVSAKVAESVAEKAPQIVPEEVPVPAKAPTQMVAPAKVPVPENVPAEVSAKAPDSVPDKAKEQEKSEKETPDSLRKMARAETANVEPAPKRQRAELAIGNDKQPVVEPSPADTAQKEPRAPQSSSEVDKFGQPSTEEQVESPLIEEPSVDPYCQTPVAPEVAQRTTQCVSPVACLEPATPTKPSTIVQEEIEETDTSVPELSVSCEAIGDAVHQDAGAMVLTAFPPGEPEVEATGTDLEPIFSQQAINDAVSELLSEIGDYSQFAASADEPGITEIVNLPPSPGQSPSAPKTEAVLERADSDHQQAAPLKPQRRTMKPKESRKEPDDANEAPPQKRQKNIVAKPSTPNISPAKPVAGPVPLQLPVVPAVPRVVVPSLQDTPTKPRLRMSLPSAAAALPTAVPRTEVAPIATPKGKQLNQTWAFVRGEWRPATLIQNGPVFASVDCGSGKQENVPASCVATAKEKPSAPPVQRVSLPWEIKPK
eukprot:TRINITY_DN10272_c0_g1_i2.p2 TRINITY_DN10272_c0_g1~~TRINITY_DN10272_c0_g1_i2.p2  ORF type:complete len:989 (-),score=142.01 TRINITY_DN10272_c0_g1_i2:3443-6409(-)